MFKDKEYKLSGEVSESRSSDSYISRTVEALISEVDGLNGKIVDIRAFLPRTVSENYEVGVSPKEDATTILSEIYNLEKLSLAQFVSKLREKRINELKHKPLIASKLK